MPSLSWLNKKKDDEEQMELRLPDAEQKKLDDALAASKAADEKIDKMMKGFESITAFVDEAKAEKEAAKAAEQQRRNKEKQDETDEEIESLIVSDPKAAIKKATENQSLAILTLRADNLRRDTFEDAEKFPHYIGEVKAEVDKLLAGQSLQAKNDPGVIENTYYTVVGRMVAQNKEKELKSRFASAESSRGNGGGNKTDSSSDQVVITDEIRRIAKMFDMKPEEYAKSLQEEGII